MHLIFEDYSTLKHLRKSRISVWAGSIVLAVVFIPLILVFLWFALFGFPYQITMSGYYRLIMGFGAIYIINIFLIATFSKPIKVYREGIDLGTIGSLGWKKVLFLAFVYYFRKTKFIAWDDIKTVHMEPSIKKARTLKIIDIKGNIYFCRIEDKKGDRFHNKLTKAIAQVVQQKKIIDS